jgi:hypothetical protein
MKAKKILKKHLDIKINKREYISEKQLLQLRYDASIDGINECLKYLELAYKSGKASKNMWTEKHGEHPEYTFNKFIKKLILK